MAKLEGYSFMVEIEGLGEVGFEDQVTLPSGERSEVGDTADVTYEGTYEGTAQDWFDSITDQFPPAPPLVVNIYDEDNNLQAQTHLTGVTTRPLVDRQTGKDVEGSTEVVLSLEPVVESIQLDVTIPAKGQGCD